MFAQFPNIQLSGQLTDGTAEFRSRLFTESEGMISMLFGSVGMKRFGECRVHHHIFIFFKLSHAACCVLMGKKDHCHCSLAGSRCGGGLTTLLRLFVYFRIDVTNTFIDLEFQDPFAAVNSAWQERRNIQEKYCMHHDVPEVLKMYLWYSFIVNSCKYWPFFELSFAFLLTIWVDHVLHVL